MSRSKKHRAYTPWDRRIAFVRVALGEFGPHAQAYAVMPVVHYLVNLASPRPTDT